MLSRLRVTWRLPRFREERPIQWPAPSNLSGKGLAPFLWALGCAGESFGGFRALVRNEAFEKESTLLQPG